MLSLKLNTGNSIPIIGLGTWQSKPGEVEKAVEIALKTGYRHIDTYVSHSYIYKYKYIYIYILFYLFFFLNISASAYGNEKEVGEAIRRSNVPREDIFVTTKLAVIDHRRVAEALDKSLQKLGMDYVSCYLMHWPVPLRPNKGMCTYKF